jgi:large subunit ribosomal protein L24
MAAKIRKNDTVQVLTGRDRGKSGQVLQVFPDDRKVLVKGVNVVKRHTKPSMTSAGGIVAKEMPLDVSNVALLDPSNGKPTRVGFRLEADGRKVRIAKSSGAALD